MLTPQTPLAEIAGPPTAAKLAKLGLHTALDLLEHYPRRHEDRRDLRHFPTSETENPVCVFATITRTSFKRLGSRPNAILVEAEVRPPADPGAPIGPSLICRWFHLPWLRNTLAAGQRIILYGRPQRKGPHLAILQPEFEIIEPGEGGGNHFDRIVPVHPATQGITTRRLRDLIASLLAQASPAEFPENLPPGHSTLTTLEAYRQIHFPDTHELLAAARRHLILAEFLQLQLTVARRRRHSLAQTRPPRAIGRALLDKFLASLPFTPTAAQTRALHRIRLDMAAPAPMRRLLQGDVGSGKTLVAFGAMLLAIETGHSATLMAPTQILAEQHYAKAAAWLAPLGPIIALRTADRREQTAPGHPHIHIGTHALLHGHTPGDLPLGLAIVDEQHKFGVLQRDRLMARGNSPDLLVMTATPIPRSLALTLYGDLETTILDEKPPGRGRVVTAVRDPSSLDKITTFLRAEIAAGRQIYIVCPLVEDNPAADAKSALAEHANWTARLAPAPCGLLHGRLTPPEKAAAMADFAAGRTAALVATTVIEVGLDIPNASVMLILDAGHFGLAQLHQLRGRVGRGPAKSWCILLISDTAAATDNALDKLRVLEQTEDGFAIAEADLRLRGAGDLIGTAQSGLPPLKLGDLATDHDLMIEARDLARQIVATEE